MTLYILFAVVGTWVYASLTFAASSLFGRSSPLLVGALSNALAGLVLCCGFRTMTSRAIRMGHASTWRRRVVFSTSIFFLGTVAVLIAGTGEVSGNHTCSGQCPPEEEGGLAVANPSSLTTGSQATAGGESAKAVAAGRALFNERGCVSCHGPDATGVGPTLNGLFGSPVQDPTCGVAIVDESYLREAIVYPEATVAVGFPSVMPSFAGDLTEQELSALIEYLKSLSSQS